MAEWRLARSLVQLREEIRQVAPGTTVWTIGDAAHQEGRSDHNPNDQGVVCAADIIDDAGLDLDWLANTVRTSGHPALKYVIFQDGISFGGAWQDYGGQYHHHVHVSVGEGPDGASTGPYDDTSPWGIAVHYGGGIIMLPQRGDTGQHVEVIQRMLVMLGFDTVAPNNSTESRYDGVYGSATEAAVAAFRQSINPNMTSGSKITPWTYVRLLHALGNTS